MAQELIDKIRAAAQAKNVNPDVAVQIARNESSLNPSSRTNASSAAGLFGVIDSTWKQFGGQPGKKLNPDENIRVGVEVIASNTDFLRRNLGREPSPSEIYTAHFFGPSGARTILSAAPDTPVSSLFSKAVLDANPHLKGKTAEQARQWLSKKMGGVTPARAQAPATAAPQPAVMEPPLGISASAAPRAVAIGDSLAEGFAKANNLGGVYKSGAGPQAVMKMLQDYAANNTLKGMTVYLGTGLPNNPAQRDAVAQQVAFIKAQGGTPVVFGAGPGSQRNPTTGQNEFLQTVAQDSGAQFTGPLATLFPAISKQDPMGLHLTPAQYKELYKQTGGAPVTAAAPASRPVATAQAAPRAAAQASAEDLGSGYKAALALAFLGDQDKDREVSDDELRTRMNRIEDEEFAQQLADYKPVNTLQDLEITALNPVKALQPVKMAEGGVVKPSAADALRNLKLKMDLPSVIDIRSNGGDFAASSGPSGTMNPATTIAVGQALQGYGNMFGGMLPGGSVANLAGNFAVNSGINSFANMQNQEAMHTLAGRFGDEALAMHNMAEGRAAAEAAANAAANEAGISAAFGNADSSHAGSDHGAGIDASGMYNKGGEVDTGERDAQESGEAKNAPTMTARESARAALNTVFGIGMGPGMGANLGYSIYKHFSGKTPLEDLLRRARLANQPIDPTRDMEPMGQSGGMRPLKRSNGSPEGGEVALTPEEIAAASRPATFNPQIARQGAAARALAARRDVNTLPDPRTYAAVSGFLGQAPDQLGFSVFHPDLQGIKRAGEAGFAASLVPVVAPVVAPVARAVGRGATALGMRTEKALEAPVTRTLERGGRSAEMLQALGAQPSFAVKPRGGDFLTSGSISAPPASKLDELLQNYSKAIQLSMPPGTDPKIVDDFVDKKARKYFTTAFGTADDPVRTAITKGEIKMFGKEAEEAGGITPYLLEAARNPNAAGHEMAKKHLEQVYDRYTNIQSRIYSTTPSSDADARRALQKVGEDFQTRNRALMTQEGVPEGFQNPPGTTILRDTDIQAYRGLYGPYVSALELRAQGTLPSQSAYLLDKSKPFYDIYTSPADIFNPMKVAEGLATLPANKLGNMSFEQAFIQGTKNMEVYRDYLFAVDRAKNNLSVPKEVIEMFTKPVDKTPGGQWVRLTDPQATRLEGALMHHSVGGYADYGSYNHGGKQAFLDGKAQVISLREPKTGRPLVTVEGKKEGDKIDFTQIKGPYNSFPSMQANDLFTLVDKDSSIQRLPGQNYYKDNAGKDLPKPISVDWGKSFDNWKAQDGAGDWIIESESPATINYIWGMPEAKARGGMVERKHADNRAYL
jgi:hypothetical protein